MLIDATTSPEGLDEAGLRWRMGQRFVVGWKGHVFVPGEAGGEDSIQRLLARLEAGACLADLMNEPSGVFGLFVYDRVQRLWQITPDNAGLYKIFWDDRGCGTSLLELTRQRGTRRDQLMPAGLIEFLVHGAVYGAETFVDGVRKLRWDEVLELSPACASPRIRRKRLVEPDPDDGQSVVAHFSPLARSLSRLKFSADVTGGIDTRLIICLLSEAGADFELAISGRAESDDVRMSVHIAELLKKPLFVTPHDLSRLEEELPLVFNDVDGQMDCCLFHRLRQHCLARLTRGVQVMSHGAGGAHFKDFFSLQDFPRYGSHNVNFDRFYSLRVAPVTVPERYLSGKGAKLLADVRPHALAQFADFKASSNSESYDRVVYFLRSSEVYGRPLSSYINLGLDVVAPLLDWRNARVAMKLSPWRRFFNGWHREVLTAHCPRLAALRTTEGFSVSSELRHLLPDVAGYVGMAGRRAVKKTSQRLLGKTWFDTLGSGTVNDPGLFPAVRGSRAFSDSLDALKDVGLFASGLEPADVRDRHVGRVLTLGQFLRHVN